MLGDGFSEGRWNCKAIPIMNELGQMGTGACPYDERLSQLYPARGFELAIASCTPLVPFVPLVANRLSPLRTERTTHFSKSKPCLGSSSKM